MAPSTPVLPETLITVKITLDAEGKVYKKAKVPYGVLTAGLSTLEAKLRDFLAIEEDKPYHFERFSDSAANHIPLVHTNPSVYRQLLRAAKAKQKLKLRVVYEPTEGTTAAAEAEADNTSKAAGPRPVTIEDFPEATSPGSETDASVPAPTPVESTMAAEPDVKNAAIVAPVPTPTPLSLLAARYKKKAQEYPDIPGHFPESHASPDASMEKQIKASMQSMAQDQDFLDRNLSLMEASIGNMNLNTTLSDSQTPPAFRAYPYSLMESYNALVNSAPAPPAPTPAVSAPNASMATTPQPIPVAKCTRNYPSAWTQGRANPSVCPAMQQVSQTVEPTKLGKLTARPPAFTVCCNSCERKIPDTHYHCSTCEAGDFDLCETCINVGITCYSPEHWMIRRNIQNGLLVNSTTERIQPRRKFMESQAAEKAATEKIAVAKAAAEEAAEKAAEEAAAAMLLNRHTKKNAEKTLSQKKAEEQVAARERVYVQIRTCNNCIRELPEQEFLHCCECYDFDLCKACFVKNDHGHHPKHAFKPAVKGTDFSWNITRRLSAGRGYQHHAVCDGCEKFITGVRHKCSDCPDWDYCSDCVLNADFIHPDHRFIPIYEPLVETPAAQSNVGSRVIHKGIYCDGPHCAASGRSDLSIRGDRYKCAVCYNKDFCATCEASPSNNHNKTHPLIKFRTPVRHVSVTTTGEHDNGRPMPCMGDQVTRAFSPVSSIPQAAAKTENISLTANKVQTVLDIKPTTAAPAAPAVKAEVAPKMSAETLKAETLKAEPEPESLGAIFQRDSIADGTVFAPNHVFEQTWVLRNTGSVAWPAGCCVRFVSGDYMGHVDPNHPAGIKELMSAFESTICYQPLAPGAEFPFTVLLRAPSRIGKAISYWRLTTPGDVKFGDRLWCDVNVQPKEEPTAAPATEEKAVKEEQESTEGSQMIFPKLEKESPIASIHEAQEVPAAPEASHVSDNDEFDDDWADDGSDDGFMTDEEYDILDASDEESFAGDKLRK
ncbi:hypothetical protein SCUCBS95973_009108 [Sporothrix curviconia]|uniref:ZZ-type domain-containing protein n=1 Tax=Sporothrix curviconia TaxID=1260050 RepID=A0ABP0CSR1_9PEZI